MPDKNCVNMPEFRYTWPSSKEAYCCQQHATQIEAIASAMGFYVQLIPLSPAEIAKVSCSQKVGKYA